MGAPAGGELPVRDDGVRPGAPEVVVVIGPPGSGKTSYLARTARSARADGAVVVWGRPPGGGAAPLTPWPDVLDDLRRAVGGPAPTPAATGTGRATRFRSAGDVLAAAATGAPVVVLLDDLHDADPAGLLLTRHIAGRGDLAGVLLVATHDPATPATPGCTAALAALRQRATRVVELAPPVPAAATRAAARLAAVEPSVATVVGLVATWGRHATTSDVAALATTASGDVVDALCAAAGAGLVTSVPPERWVLADDAVRRAALDHLGADGRLDASARAAERCASDDRPGAPARRAAHALVVARRSDDDARRAIAACADAADAALAEGSPEAAVGLLEAADELTTRLGGRRPALAVARADALVAAAEVARAREVLSGAAAELDERVEPATFARAVRRLAALDGVDDHLVSRARCAAERLEGDETVLAANLRHLVAARADRAEEAARALDAVRATGDADALADALATAYHAASGPDDAARARVAADELAEVAGRAGHDVLRLLGTLWGAAARHRLGSSGQAEALLRTLRADADVVAATELLTEAARLEVVQLLRDGRLDDAEAALGALAGPGDDQASVVPLLVLPWLRGGEVGEPPPTADHDGDRLATLARAVLDASSGHLGAAARALDRSLPARLVDLPRGPSWLAELVMAVEVARILGDRDRAAQAAELLRPYADLPALAPGATVCLGTVGRALGLAAATLDDPHAAVAHLEHAVEGNRRLANRPLVAVARADLAAALVARDAEGDLDRAVAALQQAAKEARTLGLDQRAERWWEDAASLHGKRRAGAALLRHEGHRWVVRAGDHHVIAPDLIGFRYLGVLLERPGEELAPLELIGGTFGRWGVEVDDRGSIDAYRRRVRQIDAELAEVDVETDVARIETLRGERDVLRGELAAVLGMTERRGGSGPAERARTTVCRAIARAISSLETADPELAEELRATVVTGSTCRYLPDAGRPRHWEVEVVLER